MACGVSNANTLVLALVLEKVLAYLLISDTYGKKT